MEPIVHKGFCLHKKTLLILTLSTNNLTDPPIWTNTAYREFIRLFYRHSG